MDDSKTERGGFKKGAVPLARALELSQWLQNQLLNLGDRVSVVGSVLRRKPVVGDVDILLFPNDLEKALQALTKEGFKGDDRIQRKMINGILVEIYLAHRERELGALKLYTTGDILFVRGMRELARDYGMELTPYGLYDRESRKPMLESPYERDYFEVLDTPWIPPTERSSKEKASPAIGDRFLPPKEWSPLWKRMTKGADKVMFPGVIWDLQPWRAPDYRDEGKSIWYGPDGKDGTEASVIMYQNGGWAFGQYSGVEGMVDDPPAPILSTFTFVTFEELQKAVMEKSQVEVPLDAFERSPDSWAVFAATVAAVKLAYSGGKEEWVDRLP